MDSEKAEQNKLWIESDETAKLRIEQARGLKELAKTGGLKFEAYLPGDLGVWVLELVERGVFLDPSEAVFVFMQQAKDIEPHDDIKREILKRCLDEAEKEIEAGNYYTAEEVRERLDKYKKERTEPVVWNKISQE